MKHIKIFEDFSDMGMGSEDQFPELAKYNPENDPSKLKCWWVSEQGPIISTWNDLKSEGYHYVKPHSDGRGNIICGIVSPENEGVHEMYVDLDSNENYDYVVIDVIGDGNLIPISASDVSPETAEMLSNSSANADFDLIDALEKDGIIDHETAMGSEIYIFPYGTDEIYDLTQV